jgi:hypothetical protein
MLQALGDKRPADDPPQLGGDSVHHRPLFFHPLGVVVDLARDGRHHGVALLCHGVVKTFGNGSIVKAEIACQCRRRPPQIVRRERLEAQQLTYSGRLGLVLVLLVFGCQSACNFGSDSLLMKFKRRLTLVSQRNQYHAASPTSVGLGPSRV